MLHYKHFTAEMWTRHQFGQVNLLCSKAQARNLKWYFCCLLGTVSITAIVLVFQ